MALCAALVHFRPGALDARDALGADGCRRGFSDLPHKLVPWFLFFASSMCLLREVGQGTKMLRVALCAFCVACVCSRGISADTAFLAFCSPWQNDGRCQPRFDVMHHVGSLCGTHHTLGLSTAFFASFTVWHIFGKD